MQIVAYTCDYCDHIQHGEMKNPTGKPLSHMLVVAKGEDVLSGNPEAAMAKWEGFHTFCQPFCLKAFYDERI